MNAITDIEDYVNQYPLNGTVKGKTTAEVLSEIFSSVNYPAQGLQRMSIEKLDVSTLDNSHYMVFVKWKSISLRDRSVNKLSVTYFLKESGNGGFEVVSALTNNDQLHLREKGYIE